MKVLRRMISPSNFQFYISDYEQPEIALLGEAIEVVSNGLSLTVPCQSDQEADTEFTIGAYADVPQNGSRVFEGTIPTPSRLVVVSDVAMDRLLRYPVPDTQTHLTIWTDGEKFPARIVVGVR